MTQCAALGVTPCGIRKIKWRIDAQASKEFTEAWRAISCFEEERKVLVVGPSVTGLMYNDSFRRAYTTALPILMGEELTLIYVERHWGEPWLVRGLNF